MSDYTLLTGASGLVGGFLMRDLLAGNRRLAVLIRSQRRQTPAERVESVLARWESLLDRPVSHPSAWKATSTCLISV